MAHASFHDAGERRARARRRLGFIAAAATVSVLLAACGVKGDPHLPEGVTDTKSFPRSYPAAPWPVVAKPQKTPVKPAGQPSPPTGGQSNP